MGKYLKTLPLFSKLPTHRFIEESEELIESALFSSGDSSDIARSLEDRVSSFIRCNPLYFLQCTLLFYYLFIFTLQILQRKQNGGIFSSLPLKFLNQASLAYIAINFLELLRSMTLPTDLPRERQTTYLNMQLKLLLSFATSRNLHFHLLNEGMWRNSFLADNFILGAPTINILSLIPQLLIACEVAMSLLIPDSMKGFFSRSNSKAIPLASPPHSQRKGMKTTKKNRRVDQDSLRQEDFKDAIHSFQQNYIKGISQTLCSLLVLTQLIFVALQLPSQIQSSGSHTSSSPSLRDYLITVPRVLLSVQFLLIYGRSVLPASSSSSASLQNENENDNKNNEKKAPHDDLSQRKKKKRKKKQTKKKIKEKASELPKEDQDETRSTSIINPQEEESEEEVSPLLDVIPDEVDKEDKSVNPL